MIVVAILGIVMAIGIPSIYHALNKDPMRQAISDLMEAGSQARARAILSGQRTQLVFHPLERRFEVTGGASVRGGPPKLPSQGRKSASTWAFDDRVTLEMLDINLMEFRDQDVAAVTFHPDGTCDEMTIVLHSDKNEWKKVTLEVTTSLVSVGEVR